MTSGKSREYLVYSLHSQVPKRSLFLFHQEIFTMPPILLLSFYNCFITFFGAMLHTRSPNWSEHHYIAENKVHHRAYKR